MIANPSTKVKKFNAIKFLPGHLDRVVHGSAAEEILSACDENATFSLSENVGANPALHFFRGLRHRNLAAIKLADEKPGQTLQPTALVHEAYLRLVGDANANWNGRNHFFAAAAEAMRRVLVDVARAKKRQKRAIDRRFVATCHRKLCSVRGRVAAVPPRRGALAICAGGRRAARRTSSANTSSLFFCCESFCFCLKEIRCMGDLALLKRVLQLNVWECI